jgi:hypothetical protein
MALSEKIKEGLDNETLAAVFGSKLSYAAPLVATNVPYVIEALKASGSDVSKLNIGQIQLTAPYLLDIAAQLDIENFNAAHYVAKPQRAGPTMEIQRFKKFAEANKQKYGFENSDITELTDAMHEFYNVCQHAKKLKENPFKKNPLAQALYFSHQLYVIHVPSPFVDKRRQMQKIAAAKKQFQNEVGEVLGKEQSSLLINRSEQVFSTISNKTFYSGSQGLKALFTSVDNTNKKVSENLTTAARKAAEAALKEAMMKTIAVFETKKKAGGKTLKASDKVRLDGMKEALSKLNEKDRTALDEIKNSFKNYAEQNTGFFGIGRTATGRKFEQLLNGKGRGGH